MSENYFLLILRVLAFNLGQLYLEKIQSGEENRQFNVYVLHLVFINMKWNLRQPPPSNFLADSITEWIQVFLSCTYFYTHTHTLDYSVTQEGDVVLWGELEFEEVTDARSGSFTVLITISRTFTPQSLRPEPLIISLKLFFSPCLLFAVPQNQKSVAEEKVRSEVWLLDYFSQHGEDVWACTCHQACKFSNQSQERSVYIFQNERSIFRLIDPRQSWTYWPVKCDRTLRTRRPLTWSQVGSFVMSEPWHFPLCIASLRRHLGSRCMYFFPLSTFPPLIE